MALVDKLDPKNLWQDRKYRLPYLIDDSNEANEEKKGKNKLEINEKEAEIVRFIFNEYSLNLSSISSFFKWIVKH